MYPPTRQLAFLLQLVQSGSLELRGTLLSRQTVNQDLETQSSGQTMEGRGRLTSISFPVLAII